MRTKKIWALGAIMSLCTVMNFGGEPHENIPLITPGHKSLNTAQLHYPLAVYYTKVKTPDGKWVPQGIITEVGKPGAEAEKKQITRVQVTTFNDGKSYLEHRALLQADTLLPLSNQRKSKLPRYQPGFVKSFLLAYEDGKLQGTWEKEGEPESKPPVWKLDQPMFEGDVVGVVLAALPLKKGYQARLPVMYSQMGVVYTVIAKVTGNKTFKTATGKAVKTWAVETDWIDKATGEVSPGGGSGGTYYVTTEPPPGYPHVWKYINDSFDTEILTQLTPPSR